MSFFDWNGPTSKKKIKKYSFELPIKYYRDDTFLGFFKASYQKVRNILPSEKLYPIKISPQKAIVAIAAFNYLETSIGPYGEIAVAIPVVYGKKPPLIYPALLESKYKNFGLFVYHLPVTKEAAFLAGREIWNYPKFIVDMYFKNTPEYMQVDMKEGKELILSLKVNKKGKIIKDERPIITYTEMKGKIIKTVIPTKGIYMLSLSKKNGELILGNHPVSETIKQLEIEPQPFSSRVYLERFAILPEGEIVGDSSKEYNGYLNKKKTGKLEISYE